METIEMKRIEIDGPPAKGEAVWVVCSGFRCLGKIDNLGKWTDVHRGNVLENVLGYYPLVGKEYEKPASVDFFNWFSDFAVRIGLAERFLRAARPERRP